MDRLTFIVNLIAEFLTLVGKVILFPFRFVVKTLKSFTLPKLELPKLKIPEFKLPKFVLPKVKLPTLKVATLKVTKAPKKKSKKTPKKTFQLPKLPKLVLPKIKISVPKLPKFHLHFPKITLPKITAPKIKLPQFNLPKIVLPKLKWPKRTPKPVQIPLLPDVKKIVTEKVVVEKTKARKIFERALFFIFGAIFTLLFIMMPFEVYAWFRELPKADLLVTDGNNKSTKILDRNGKLLYEIYVDRKYDPVTLDQIPDIVKKATLAVEDADFYNHKGVSPAGIIRAARETLFGGNVQGGSTITQQLIKNVLLTPERTLSRKAKELVLAVFVEMKYSKDQIFELYLNNISYGGTAWGVQSASKKYYGKSVWELDLAEASMLAGLPSAPSAYSPLYDLTLAKGRQHHVLWRMMELGYITQDQADSAYAEELHFAEQGEFIKAPHFVHFVRKELEKMYGKRMVETGGLTVTTTLDLDLQEKVETIVKEEVAKDANLNLTNGAAVVLDAQYGGILAHVGSVDYYTPGWGAYDVVTAYRQPGSSIKPVTYALALSKGYTPATTIKDEAVTYVNPGSQSYTPVNYDGKYHGNVTLRAALANSYNIPAVKLAKTFGPDNIVDLGKQMGLTNWLVDGSYGLSVTLGGKEVRLLDLTNVYATFARKGVRKDVTPFLSIKDSRGYEIYNANTRSEQKVLSEEVSYLIWNILSDNNARTPAFGPNSSLVVPGYKVAVKTGTTNDKKDNWTLGFTPSYAFGVWVGNNNGALMNQYLASGLTGASPIWNRIAVTTLSGKSDEQFDTPANVFVKTDSKCGRSEYFAKGSNIPSSLCPKDDEKDKDKDKKEKKDD